MRRHRTKFVKLAGDSNFFKLLCSFVVDQIGFKLFRLFFLKKKKKGTLCNSDIDMTESILASYHKTLSGTQSYGCRPLKTNHSPVSLRWPRPALPALLKSVPVSWARMRKERDWVVPVRGCQSSVSWISLLLLRSLGIKQGMFSALRPCLHTHPPAAHGRHESLWNTCTRMHTHTHTCTPSTQATRLIGGNLEMEDSHKHNVHDSTCWEEN